MYLSRRWRLPEPPARVPPLPPGEFLPCFPRVVRLHQTCRLLSGRGAARLPPRRPLSRLCSPRCPISATSRRRRGKSSWPSWIGRRKKRRRSSRCSSKDPAPSRLPPPRLPSAPSPAALRPSARPDRRLCSAASAGAMRAAAAARRRGCFPGVGARVCVSGREGSRPAR